MDLPKASRMVLASKICCSTQVLTPEVTEHRYCRMNLVDSVLPAPDSPEMTQLWFWVWFLGDDDRQRTKEGHAVGRGTQRN